MRLIIEMNGQKLLLSPQQADDIATLLHGCERIDNKYMGRSTGGGSEYIDLIVPAVIRDIMKLGVVSDLEYSAMVFITAQQNQTK